MKPTDNHIVPDVKLSFLVKEGPFDVLLKNECFILPIQVLLFAIYLPPDLFDILQDHNSISSVSVFPGLQDPYVLEVRALPGYPFVLFLKQKII